MKDLKQFARQFRILTTLIQADEELCYYYSWLEENTGYSREVLKAEITDLREQGLVEHVKGLMSEEGEVKGSGFQIPYGKRKEVWALIEENCEHKDVRYQRCEDCNKWFEPTPKPKVKEK